MKNINDLTDGSIWKKLIIYFLPIAAGTLLQQLYNTVDAVIVGKYVGTEALAAVGGSPAQLSNLLIGFFTSLAAGAAVVIAQHYGAKNYRRVSQEVYTSITFCTLVGILLGLIVIASAPTLLKVMQTPEDTFDMATTYTRIYFCGTLFILIYNMASGILRAVGDSRTPFVLLIVSCLLNIALDLIFILKYDLGVAGAAWATVIAQGVSAVAAVVILFLSKEECIRIRKFKIRWDILGNMLRIGVPAGVQSAMYGLSNLILQIGVNTLGTVVVASWSMSGKIDGLYWATSSAFGTAVTNFVGQNYGAARMDRIKQCVKTSTKLFAGITLALSAIILIIAQPLLTVFSDDPAVRETTWHIITYFVPFYLFWTIIEVFSGVLRGVGDAIKPMIIIALSVCVLRLVWECSAFMIWHTLPVLSACYPISWAVADVALLWYYFRGSMFKTEHPWFRIRKWEK